MENFIYKYNIFLILFTLIFIFLLYINITSNNNNILYNSSHIIDKSSLENAGRGVFANKNYKKGEIVETSPYIILDKNTINTENLIQDYVFDHLTDSSKKILVFGYGSMYNHSTNYNIDYEPDINNQCMIYIANKDIIKGNELFINYGEDYWNSR